MRKQNHLSLSTFTILLVTLVQWSIVSASSSCSSFFRFDQLCPDPRFGSPKDNSGSSNFAPDTNIQLNSNNYNFQRSHSSHGGRNPSGINGVSYTSSMLVKDPSTTSCDFILNGIETAVVTGVHVTENPWDFRHANTCTHIVKISHDLFEGGQLGGGGYTSNSRNIIKAKGSNNNRVCKNEIGIRRRSVNHDVSDPNRHDVGHDEELAKKMNVYFWHNFTVNTHSVEFTDTITNYHLSRDDVACVREREGKFVQLAILVSKSGRCEVIVQQYKIELNRSPWGCAASGNPIPFPIQFCGSYECAQTNSILTGLKLLSRRIEMGNKQDSRPVQPQTGDYGNAKGPSYYNTKEESKGNMHYNKQHFPTSSTTLPPCTTTSTDDDDEEGEEDDEDKPEKPRDWREALFLSAFPALGVLLILIVLYILRARSAREICRGYPYQNPSLGIYIGQGSCSSIDKNNQLPM